MTRLIHVDSVHEAFWLLLALLEGLIRWFNSLEGEFLERWKMHTSSPPRQDTTSAMCLLQGLEPKMHTTFPHLQTGPWWPRFHWCRRKPEETKQLSNIWLKIPLQSRFKDPDVFYDVESFFNSYQAFLSCFSFAHFFLLSVRRWGLGFSSSLDWCKGTCPISGGTCERIWCRYEMDDLMLLIHWYRHVSVFLKSKQVWWSNLKSV